MQSHQHQHQQQQQQQQQADILTHIAPTTASTAQTLPHAAGYTLPDEDAPDHGQEDAETYEHPQIWTAVYSN
ncbi:hypothetical protein KEM52_005063, partial [Ascosphaera acerosa]